jgi:hypothetical protein
VSSFLSAVNPLSYLGVRPVTPPPVTFQQRAPTTDDVKNFVLSTIWMDLASENAYMLVDNASGVGTWKILTGGSGSLDTITTPDAVVVTPVANNINFLNGAGISITGSGDNVTVAATAAPFIVPWSVIVAASKTIIVNEGYFANRGGGVAFTLPAAAAVGDVFYLSALHADGWSLGQSAGQSVQIGSFSTTVGGGGSLASNAIGNSIFAVCAVANLTWVVQSSMGNITVV